MRSAVPLIRDIPGRRPGRPPGRRPGHALATAAHAATGALASRRTYRDLLFCLISVPLAVAGFVVTVGLLIPGGVAAGSVAGIALGVTLIVLALRFARQAGRLHRRLAGRVLGLRIAEPARFRPGRGLLGRVDARLRDAVAWRAVAYLLLKLALAVLGAYAVFVAAAGLADLSYPLWWPLFRNHPPGTRLGPVDVLNPFAAGGSVLHITSYPGTFAAFAVGMAGVLAAPWLARLFTAADQWLMHGLLAPGRLAERVRQLEESRALAVDDSAARLRRVERDLHDGAQVRLATLALSLGLAREKLGAAGQPGDLASARELIEAAHDGAKDALADLRDLVRGIHPPVLDTGLPDALATLAAASPLPVQVITELPVRPSPAIETIAYFCAAELLANATKHSSANQVVISLSLRGPGPEPWLDLLVSDDGTGGADPAGGTGLAGLAQRAAVVDGRLGIVSPPGGPTRVRVELPLRA